MVKMIQHGVLMLKKKDKISTFLLNGQRFKHYFKNNGDRDKDIFELNDE